MPKFAFQRQRDRPPEPVEHDREAAGPEQVGRPQPDQQLRAKDPIGVKHVSWTRFKLSDFDVEFTNVRFE